MKRFSIKLYNKIKKQIKGADMYPQNISIYYNNKS